MREAAAAERQAIHRLEIQEILAQEVGLAPDQFMEDIKNGKAEGPFREDLQEYRSRGNTGFPTFLIHNFKGIEIILRGYQRFESFESAFQKIAGDTLRPNPIVTDEQSILAFVRKYGKVASKEVAEVFNLTKESAREWLSQLKEKGFLKEQKAGNGFFYSIPKNPFTCDPEAGMCLTL